MNTSKLSHNVLKYWLGCIADNGNGLITLTHWEINLIITSIIDNFGFDNALMIRILPLLCILKQRDKSHKHKRLVASFALKLIDDYEQLLSLDVFWGKLSLGRQTTQIQSWMKNQLAGRLNRSTTRNYYPIKNMILNQSTTYKFTNLDSLSSKVDIFNFEDLDIYLDFFSTSDCHDEFDILGIIKNIKLNFCGWVKSGLLLKCIKDNFKFVLQSRISKSWKDFCLTRLNKSSWVCNNFIRSAEVVLILFKNGFDTLPSYESHARILAKFLPNLDQMSDAEIEDCEDRICELWNNILSASAGKHLTMELITSIVEPDKESNQKVLRLSPKLYEKLLDQAIKNGYLSINEYLENLDEGGAIAPDENTTTQDQVRRWELDLADLVDSEPQPLPQPETLPLPQPQPETLPLPEPEPEPQPEPEPETLPHWPTDNSHNPCASRVLDSVCMSPNVFNPTFLLEDES